MILILEVLSSISCVGERYTVEDEHTTVFLLPFMIITVSIKIPHRALADLRKQCLMLSPLLHE